MRVGRGGVWRSRDFEDSCLDTRVLSPYNWWLSLNTRRLWRTTGMHYENPVRCAGSPAVRERWRATRSLEARSEYPSEATQSFIEPCCLTIEIEE